MIRPDRAAPWYAGLWLFAWDLAGEGIDRVMAWAADSGITALQIAGSYHAGWFLHPHHPIHRAYMPEDGCVYFHPDPALYGELKPRVAAACRETDWMAAAADRLDRHGLRLVSWTVCCHNTRLGLAHPGCTVLNCFGDSYPHALCPANGEVRRYVASLCRDLSRRYPLQAVQLESPGYLGWRHGHHHERDLTVLSPAAAALMDLCFCASCEARAGDAGIDAPRLRARVRATLDRAMDAAPDSPDPDEAAELATGDPDVEAYRRFRETVEDTLLAEIREAMRPSAAELWLLEPYRTGHRDAIDAYDHCIYGQPPDRAEASTRAARSATPADRAIHMGIRLGLNSVSGPAQLADLVAAVRRGGADGVMFYNYSESPRRCLDWIAPALGGE